jgi:Gram-negative bacterial TonB protein C-terminal
MLTLRYVALMACASPRLGRSKLSLVAVRRVIAAFVIALVSYPSCGMGADEPTVFNHTAGPLTDLDKLAHEHYGKTYNVVDVTDQDHVYVGPKGVSGFGPPAAVYAHEHCISGRALVLYIVRNTGEISSPYAVKLSDALLKTAAVQAVSRFRFRPARLDGRPVSAVAVSMLTFTCPAQSTQ